MSVENTFGKWKGRFIRSSKRVDMEISSIVVVITASCILHNICQIKNNAFLPIWQIDNEAFQEPVVFSDDDVAMRDATDSAALYSCSLMNLSSSSFWYLYSKAEIH